MLKQKPSDRLRRRYLLVKGNKREIEKAILDYVGILGWAKAAPVFVKMKDKEVILAVNRKELDKIKGAFSVAAERLQVLKISGTLKGLGKK